MLKRISATASPDRDIQNYALLYISTLSSLRIDNIFSYSSCKSTLFHNDIVHIETI